MFSFVATAQNSIPAFEKYICPPCNNICDEKEYQEQGVCGHCNMVLVRKDFSKTIAFYLQDGVEVLDFAGPMEVFSYAGYKVFTVSANKAPIKSQGILSIIPDYSIEDAPSADILAFFGGNANAVIEDKEVINWVKNQQNVKHYFSVCTGAFVLAEAGILDERVATTFHNALDNLKGSYPKIDVRDNVRFVDNGREVTTAGISAGIDGALHLVAKLQGLNVAKRTAYYMEYDNWKIGDGLILSSDNPYVKRTSRIELSVYEGKYEFKDGITIDLVYNSIENQLEAIVQEKSYPIYHESEDIFSDINNEPIFFNRNASNQITGYSLQLEGTEFKKLD